MEVFRRRAVDSLKELWELLFYLPGVSGELNVEDSSQSPSVSAEVILEYVIKQFSNCIVKFQDSMEATHEAMNVSVSTVGSGRCILIQQSIKLCGGLAIGDYV